MTVDINGTTFEGYEVTIISSDREHTPELVSEVARVESSGVDIGVTEAYASGHRHTPLEISHGGYGDHYEVEGITGKSGQGILSEMCEEEAKVTILSDDCEMIDDDFTVRDLTFFDQTVQADDGQPRYHWRLILEE